MTFERRLIFFFIVTAVLISLQLLVLSSFKKFLARKGFNKKKLNYAAVSLVSVLNFPHIFFFLLRFDVSKFPDLLYYTLFVPYFVYQSAMFFIGIILLAIKIIKSPFSLTLFILKKFNSIQQYLSGLKSKRKIVKFDKSRRAFIASSGVFLTGYAFIGAGVGVLRKDKYEIIRQTIHLKNLPDSLKGVTVTLISDIHSGPYMPEDKMNEYVKIINELKSDLIVIPGDLTNTSKDEIYPFVNSFKNLKAKHGIYSTLGNHDYFSDPEFIAEVITNETPFKMLRNNSEIININGDNLIIIGTEDTRDSGAKQNEVILKYISTAKDTAINKAIEKNINYNTTPKILLCHKPYIFDNLNSFDIDLVFSGHTHGGQVIFASLGDYSLSFASLVNKYVSGLYLNGNRKLYVSRGIGTVGLPIRVNCPPEITVLTLM
ncbi:MAG: metallophosphoesterase [Ignavibacteria bacterium]|nr:metallophosphoesterase [Ignavibacteria bacterium]